MTDGLTNSAKRMTLAATILGSMVVFLDGSVVNVALPALKEDLNAGLASQQWVVEAYLLTLSSLILVGGSLGDVLGRRRIFVTGLAGFGVTSLMCAVAPSDETLVVARGLQGIAGALLVPSSLAILTATFSEGERGAAVGSWTAWTGISFVIGPLVGGLLIDEISWRWVFAINLPIVLATLYLTARCVEESRDPRADGRVDIPGAVLCVGALGGPVFALIEQPLHGWTDPLVLAPLVAGVVCGAAFVWWERHAPAPMLRLSLFGNRNFTVTNLATLAIYGGLSATTFFVVLFLQQVAGYTALQAGLALMPITVLMFTLSRRTGALAERVGPRLPMTVGPLIAGAGLLLFTGVGRDPSYASDLLPGVLVFGLGLSLTVAPLTATVLGAVDERHAGIASGVNNAVARVAGLVAIAAVGAVVAGSFGNTLDHRVRGLRLLSGSEQSLAEARRSPLTGSRSPEIDPPLGPAVDRASERAFHTGMVVSGLLVILGGLLAGAGIRNARPLPAAVPT